MSEKHRLEKMVESLRRRDEQGEAELVEALRSILGWREVDLPEGDRAKRAIEYMESVASEALAKHKGEGGGDE